MDPLEDENDIDLRQVARALLRYKWLIIGLPIAFGLAAFLFSRLFLPKEYQATADILITKPNLVANFDSRLQNVQASPDFGMLADLATNDDMLNDLSQKPEVKQALGKPVTADDLKGSLKAAAASSQLHLTVTSASPDQAQVIANTWSDLVAARINQLYGVSDTSLKALEDQIKLSKQNWEQSEQALLNQLPQNQVNALQVRLDQAQETLKDYLAKTKDLDLIISDAQNLDGRLAKQDGAAVLRLEDALILISLNQRAAVQYSSRINSSNTNNPSPSASVQSPIQVQVSATDLTTGQYSITQARSNLQNFISALQSQREQLQKGLETQQGQVTQLTSDLEKASFEKTQLTVQRDLAQAAYQALSSHAEETRISIAQNDQTARVASHAARPLAPSGPRTTLNTLIAAFAGFILSVLFALLREWWLAPARPIRQAVTQPQA